MVWLLIVHLIIIISQSRNYVEKGDKAGCTLYSDTLYSDKRYSDKRCSDTRYSDT